MSQESFNKLLGWLDPDPETAAQKYLKIQLRLTTFFMSNRCGNDSEDLADETIDRVMRKLDEGTVPDRYVGDKVFYFLGFARNIFHEYRRRHPPRVEPVQSPPLSDDPEDNDACLESCRKPLSPEDQWLAIEYYRYEEAKSEHHIRLAEQLGLSLAGLRTRIHRIRKVLKPCIEECLERRQN
ncbi:MAG: hypothetical protein M3539_13640 [Acidobacteriota bacterium]|nr:hypothetical protein [Acidobacteriota bacterium]